MDDWIAFLKPIDFNFCSIILLPIFFFDFLEANLQYRTARVYHIVIEPVLEPCIIHV